jgi:hypothetical protein
LFIAHPYLIRCPFQLKRCHYQSSLSQSFNP